MAALAAAQHGVVTRAQLMQLGWTRDRVDWQVGLARLHVIYRGLYALGHVRLTQRGRWLAAVLAAGPGAVLSHRSAAALHGIRQSDRIEVTAPNQRRLPAPIVCHRGVPATDEITTIDGIPTTGIHRTLLDLAAVIARSHLAAAMAEAERQRLTDALSLDALIARHRGRRGLTSLKRVAEEHRATPPARSELERRFLALVRRHGLPKPHHNRLVCGVECDVVWTDQRVIVELDSRAHHTHRAAFERDRARDLTLAAAGWLVVRITWRQLHHERTRLVAHLRALLARRT